MARYNVDARIVPKDDPNADSESFIVELDEEQTRQLKVSTWNKMNALLEPFIPSTHFLVAIRNIEVING